MKKITVHTPQTHTKIILEAINKSGAGIIGSYDYCSFITQGIGTFRPLENSKPIIGELNKIEFVMEDKVEFVCPDELVKNCIEQIKNVHPYEEVAYCIIDITK